MSDPGIERSGQATGARSSLSASNSAIDELTKRLRASAGSAHIAPQRRPPASRPRRYVVTALVTICMLSGAAFFGVRMWPRAGQAARALASRVASTVPLLRDMMASPQAPADEPPEQPAARAASRRTPHSVRPQPPLVSRPPLAHTFVAPPVVIERPPIPPSVAIEEAADASVYSSADPEVAPPRPHLADAPGPGLGGRRPPEDTLELLVSDMGFVERATLHTRQPQMLDSMLLSRVKTWRFDPARRQGHPVAYRLLLVWDGSQFVDSGPADQ